LPLYPTEVTALPDIALLDLLSKLCWVFAVAWPLAPLRTTMDRPSGAACRKEEVGIEEAGGRVPGADDISGHALSLACPSRGIAPPLLPQ